VDEKSKKKKKNTNREGTARKSGIRRAGETGDTVKTKENVSGTNRKHEGGEMDKRG